MTVGELKEYLEAIPDSHEVWFWGEKGHYSPNTVKIRRPWTGNGPLVRMPPQVFITYIHRYPACP